MEQKSTLAEFLPENTAVYVQELLQLRPTHLKVVADRVSKQGDFRPPQMGVDHHRITINRGLNPYAFLITLIHELAHRETWVQYQRKVKPHGAEWKFHFKRLMAPLLADEIFPHAVVRALAAYLVNPKASSCTDAALHRILTGYDDKPVIHLENLPIGTAFRLSNGRVFVSQRKKRTRYVCKEVRSNILYLVHGLAQVEPLG